MDNDKASLVAAVIVFENVIRDLGLIRQHMIDHSVDYRYTRRLQTIDNKLQILVNDMKEDL